MNTKNLFLIDGASGTGKSYLIKHITSFNIDAAYVAKYTTRKERYYEKDGKSKHELIFVSSNEEFNELNLDYRYEYNGFLYGFSKDKLDEALKFCPNVFVIVRNAKVMQRIKEDYNFLNVVPVFIYSNIERIRQRLIMQGFSKGEQNIRIEKIETIYQEYLRHPNLYDEILINNSSVNEFYRLIDRLIERHQSKPEIIEKHQSKPEIDEREIFLMMSFNPNNPHLIDYGNAIKRAVNELENCNGNDFNCKSLHDLTGSFNISQTAIENIQSCRLAIIDLTENSLNVYYELGYVHGISKKCIITAHKNVEIPFYPREYKVIVYNNATELEEKLIVELKKVLCSEDKDSSSKNK